MKKIKRNDNQYHTLRKGAREHKICSYLHVWLATCEKNANSMPHFCKGNSELLLALFLKLNKSGPFTIQSIKIRDRQISCSSGMFLRRIFLLPNCEMVS